MIPLVGIERAEVTTRVAKDLSVNHSQGGRADGSLHS